MAGTARSGLGDANAVARALRAPPVPVPRLLEARELLPAAPGFYCWWSRRGAIAGVPDVPHLRAAGLSLLYVGISPVREASRQMLRSRVLGNHLNGNVGSSTFRFVFAALLIDELALHPYLRGGKVALTGSDNARLSGWQREQLQLSWCARERPWQIEAEVIALLSPPLNSAGNAAHGFYPTVRDARAEFRRRAADAPGKAVEAGDDS